MSVRVLIIEDNPVARGFLRRVVGDSFSDSLDIIEAGNLDSARRLIGELDDPSQAAPDGRFKLLLIDLELPDGSGMELLADLSLHRYPATKIVTTLYSDDEHLFPALQCGADGYLLKEDRFEVLVEELQKIVRGQPPLSPAIARRLLTHFQRDTVSAGAAPPADSRPSPFADTRAMSPASGQPQLTARESEVLTFLSKGFTVKEIADLMAIKRLGVNDHIKSIYKRLNVRSQAKAALLASRQVFD